MRAPVPSPRARRALAAFACLAGVGALAAGALTAAGASGEAEGATLVGRAVLPAETFAPGPPSGAQLGTAPVNGVTPPFDDQPVQGFSAVLRNGDGTYWAMADNGYGNLENSADFNLRVYRIRPDFRTAKGGSGTIGVLEHIELRDPDKRIPFAIVNHFSKSRILTGADFDIESLQRAPDGTLWFGDEFGPFLLHTDRTGKVLEPPVPLPDPDNPGKEIRSPQSPYSEESTSVRLMNAVRAHARAHGAAYTPVLSPWDPMLDDQNPNTFVDNRKAPPPGSGLAPASSEVHNVASLHTAGFDVVPYTINDSARMADLLKLGVDGIISDRSDLLYAAVKAFDANGDGTPGDYIGADGLIDPTKVDAQGHRGWRDLRPENTLPAFEVGLDNLMTTLETDVGVTKDGVTIHDHDPYIQSEKCRRADGAPYGADDEVLIKELTAAEIQSTFICDKVFRGPSQSNDRSLSPVSVAFAKAAKLADPYAPPTTQQLFDFVEAYVAYYKSGPGASAPDAGKRWRNAERVRFNIETKINPRTDRDDKGVVQAERTVGPKAFVAALAGVIAENGLEARADIQSFDWRTLLLVQERYPKIRTVYLVGDFPTFADRSVAGTDDGTNLQPQGGDNTPWLAGLYWPYRSTALTTPFRALRSGGFEGMAITPDGRKLLPLLEQPLVGDDPKTLRINTYDLGRKRYLLGERYTYPLGARGTNISDFILTDEAHGLVIERDGSQGDLAGFKSIERITLGDPGEPVAKTQLVDLQRIADPDRISEKGPGAKPGDVGLGDPFAFPFQTIEDVVVLGKDRIGVLNDNNFPFSVGRHVGAKAPDDEEFIVLRLPGRLDAK